MESNGFLHEIALLDDILQANRSALGGDYSAYRNHTYRVANICLVLAPEAGRHLDKLAIAVACHDLGIWTAGTFDYLPPSRELAAACIVRRGAAEWGAEIDETIRQHHKLTRYRALPGSLVEPFRKADLVDVSGGLVRFGLSRRFVKNLYAAWPAKGFHGLLARLVLKRARTHPLSPLPMLKL